MFVHALPELVPVGIVKELYVYPVKSCKGISVFSFFCNKLGVVSGENVDRQFVVVDGKSGKFYSGRKKPQMVLIECEVHDGILNVKTRDGNTLQVDIQKVRQKRVVRRAAFQLNLLADGLDCGDEAAEFFSKALEEQDVRLLMYSPDLFSERICVTQEDWWNNNTVPKRKEKSGFENLSPLMITTQGSLDDLNSKLENEQAAKEIMYENALTECDAMLCALRTRLAEIKYEHDLAEKVCMRT
ncbi:MOSC beta barrel domain protein [Cooperia oncophora]